MHLKDQQVKGLLAALRETNDEEIDCQQFLELVPQLLEAGAPGASSSRLAKAAAHERLCANCREEAEVLRLLLATSGRDPS